MSSLVILFYFPLYSADFTRVVYSMERSLSPSLSIMCDLNLKLTEILKRKDSPDEDIFPQIDQTQREILEEAWMLATNASPELLSRYSQLEVQRRLSDKRLLNDLEDVARSGLHPSECLHRIITSLNQTISMREMSPGSLQEAFQLILSTLDADSSLFMQKRQNILQEVTREKEIGIIQQKNQFLESEVERLSQALKRRDSDNLQLINSITTNGERSSRNISMSKTHLIFKDHSAEKTHPSKFKMRSSFRKTIEQRGAKKLIDYEEMPEMFSDAEEGDITNFPPEYIDREEDFGSVRSQNFFLENENDRLQTEVKHLHDKLMAEYTERRDSDARINIINPPQDQKFTKKVEEIRKIYQDELDNVRKQLSSEKSNHRREIDQLESEFKRIAERDKLDMQSIFEKKEKLLKFELEQNKINLDSIMFNSNKEIRSRNDKIMELENTQNKSRIEIQKLEGDLTSLTYKHKSCKEEYEENLEKNQSLKIEANDLQTNYDELHSQFMESRIQIEAMQLESDSLAQELEEEKDKVRDLAGQISLKDQSLVGLRIKLNEQNIIHKRQSQRVKDSSTSHEESFLEIISTLKRELAVEKNKNCKLKNSNQMNEDRLYNEIGNLHGVLFSKNRLLPAKEQIDLNKKRSLRLLANNESIISSQVNDKTIKKDSSSIYQLQSKYTRSKQGLYDTYATKSSKNNSTIVSQNNSQDNGAKEIKRTYFSSKNNKEKKSMMLEYQSDKSRIQSKLSSVIQGPPKHNFMKQKRPSAGFVERKSSLQRRNSIGLSTENNWARKERLSTPLVSYQCSDREVLLKNRKNATDTAFFSRQNREQRTTELTIKKTSGQLNQKLKELRTMFNHKSKNNSPTFKTYHNKGNQGSLNRRFAESSKALNSKTMGNNTISEVNKQYFGRDKYKIVSKNGISKFSQQHQLINTRVIISIIQQNFQQKQIFCLQILPLCQLQYNKDPKNLNFGGNPPLNICNLICESSSHFYWITRTTDTKDGLAQIHVYRVPVCVFRFL